MPRISRIASTHTASELVSFSDSDSDSESSINSSAHYGSGEEGFSAPKGTANSSGDAPHTNSCDFTSPVHAIVGTFCAATAVAGGIMLIYGGMGNSNFFGDQHDLYRALFGAGAAMLGTGSLVTMLCVLRRPDTAGQLPVVSA